MGDISFNKWRFEVTTAEATWPTIGPATLYFLHIEADEKCNVTGEPLTWRSRKWLIVPTMTDGEIIRTAFKAVMTAVEHETREQFLFRAKAIMDPHFEVDAA